MSNITKLLPSRSAFSSRALWENACWKKLVRLPNILFLIATTTERRKLIMRTAALDRLRVGMPQLHIARDLQLSRQTIHAIKKAMSEDAYRSYWERGKTERKKRTNAGITVRRVGTQRAATHGKKRVKTKYGTVYLP